MTGTQEPLNVVSARCHGEWFFPGIRYYVWFWLPADGLQTASLKETRPSQCVQEVRWRRGFVFDFAAGVGGSTIGCMEYAGHVMTKVSDSHSGWAFYQPPSSQTAGLILNREQHGRTQQARGLQTREEIEGLLHPLLTMFQCFGSGQRSLRESR